MGWFTVVLPVVTLLVGAVLTFIADSARDHRKRRETLLDGINATRAHAYVDFLTSAHNAAHLLGRMTPGCPHPFVDGVDDYWLLDSDVVSRLRNVELMGSDDVVESARAYRSALQSFRTAFDAGFVYDTPKYWSAYNPVTVARTAFISTVRAELTSVR